MQIWRFYWLVDNDSMFLDSNLEDWIRCNFTCTGNSAQGESWYTFFAAVLDKIWCTRNELVFMVIIPNHHNLLFQIHYVVEDIRRSREEAIVINVGGLNRSNNSFLYWSALEEGVMKINCDAAVGQLGDFAVCRFRWFSARSTRNSCGAMLEVWGFALVQAALWAVFRELHIAMERNQMQTVVESDSLIAIDLLKKECCLTHPNAVLVARIKEMAEPWSLSILCMFLRKQIHLQIV
uniref:Uncharacterized protein LOC105851797 n=1 Tax=Cicer arietinum TaxID=3827 RepID=A0A3Q7XXB0_CICAR|nr:uncharacterized protein LOC105851797 [Cicer arietinum]